MDSEQDNSTDQPREDGPSGVGPLLRRAREAKGLSLGELATRTRIPMRQLEVIEAGAFSSLPSRTYAIGFARTYARALDLNEGEITAAVRAELGDVSEARSVVPGGMEPGDPAKLPSRGLAWAGGIAALLLALGLFAWFSSQFRAGEGAPPLVAEPEPQIAQRAPATNDGTPTANAGGTVVFTALTDGIWVRVFEQEGGERFLEKTLTKGESFTVPAAARDPRINTARPDALAVTIDGKPAAPLAARAVVLSAEPVSAAALLARTAAAASGTAPSGATPQDAAAQTAAPPRRRAVAPRVREASEELSAPDPAPSPPAAPDPAPAPAPVPQATPTSPATSEA